MLLKVDGPNDFLWQWDLDRRLLVCEDTCTEIHFSSDTMANALVLAVYEENGQRYANVPNILLQHDGAVNVYLYLCDEASCRTLHQQIFRVLGRPKPEDYVYTETEVKRWEALEERVRLEIAEMKQLISAIPKFDNKPVEELPEVGKEYVIYLVKGDISEKNMYSEYIWVNGAWELLGTVKADIDMGDYVKKTEANQVVKEGVANNDIPLTSEEQAAAQAWLGGQMVKTIKAGEEVLIEDLADGFYFAEATAIVRPSKYSQLDTVTRGISLLVMHGNGVGGDHYTNYVAFNGGVSVTDIIWGYADGPVNTTRLSAIAIKNTAQEITGAYTFAAQPLMTAELAADDNSTNIPNTKWVNDAIAAALAAKGL